MTAMADTPEIAALRELLDARHDAERWFDAVDRATALLAAHDAQSGETVEVRAAVGVAPSGHYYVIGWNGGEDGSPEYHVRDEMGSAVPIHHITARVPLPQSQEIKGRVEHG